MSSLRKLAELSALTTGVLPPGEAVERALPLLREGLGASDLQFIYGADAGFRSFGATASPSFSDVALWLINQDLTSRDGVCAFDVREGRVEAFRAAASRHPCEYVAALVPVSNRTAEMVVARGMWPRGFGAGAHRFLRSALPATALILERRLDSSRAERQRHQLSALANISRVMSRSEDLEAVLTSIAGTISTVTGIDYICVDIVDADGNVKLRCVNSSRPGTEELWKRWQRGASRPDPVRRTVLAKREPLLFAEAQTDERIPEGGRNYFTRTLIRSTACFPLLAKDEVLGVLSFASHRPLEFTSSEIELLEGLAAQVAAAIKGIQLYQELAESGSQLKRLNDQLQQSMGVEHHLARTDTLTGIPNLRFLDETIQAECTRARRYGKPLSIVMADVDHFKLVNDQYGHAAGDHALRFVARLARESCREVDVVGRRGGDEFLFVLPATSLKDAAIFAERFRERLAENLVPNPAGDPIQLTISLGVAQWDDETMKGPGCMLDQADQVMYAAKALGRNRTMVADGDSARAA